MLLLNDYESKVFATQDEMKDFLKKQKDEDVWTRIYISEMSIKPLENNPICLDSIKKGLGITVSDGAVQEAMESTQLAVNYPLNDKFVTIPLRYTALPSLMDRASIYGTSLSASSKGISPTLKADVYNSCLSNKNGKALILLRDDKVSGLLSGDENDYSILNSYELISTLETSLRTLFPNSLWKEGIVSHEYVACLYSLNDLQMANDIRDILIQNGVPVSSDIEAYVKFTTSDVASSSAAIQPYIHYEGTILPIGKPLGCTHKHKHTVQDFADVCLQTMSMFRDASDNLIKLSSYSIKNPGGCLRSIACFLGLPKKGSLHMGETFDNYSECTGFEV